MTETLNNTEWRDSCTMRKENSTKKNLLGHPGMSRKRFGFLFWQIIVYFRRKEKSHTVNKEARNLILSFLQKIQAIAGKQHFYILSRNEMFRFWSATECFDTAFFMTAFVWLWSHSCSLWNKTVKSWKLPQNRTCIPPAALPVVAMIISMLHTGKTKLRD